LLHEAQHFRSASALRLLQSKLQRRQNPQRIRFVSENLVWSQTVCAFLFEFMFILSNRTEKGIQ